VLVRRATRPADALGAGEGGAYVAAMTDPIAPADMTLDELRVALTPRIPAHAAFDGWGEAALAEAARELGVPADRARLAFPAGAIDMIDAWFATIDLEMARRVPPEQLATAKIRDRITMLIRARLDAVAFDREALRRALAVLALPQNVARAARLGWRSADRMWRLAGDTAVDFNFYTKRATLGRGLCGDAAGVPGRRQRRVFRDARLPGPPDRGSDAVREVQGADQARARPLFQPGPVSRPAALSGAVARGAPRDHAQRIAFRRDC
jgi:ubiquinone biosynthesis protein COQ9